MLKRIYQNFYLIAMVLFAVLAYMFQKRLGGDTANVSDMAALIVCCAFFVSSGILSRLEYLEQKLKKWLEPQTYSSGSKTLSPVAPMGLTPGAVADASAEAEIVAKGLTAPRVTNDQIHALMDKLTWRFEQPEGTTSTFAHAFLDRFYLATGHSACVSPENFDAAMGMKYARDQAEGKARDKLWELEGYALAKSLAAA